MWTYTQDELDSATGYKLSIHQGAQAMSLANVIRGWQQDVDFRGFYISLLAELPFEAIFWEMPAVTTDSMLNKYEFVVVDSPLLASVNANPQSFEHKFQSASPQESVVAFENLGHDAMLVVPCPIGQNEAYPHLMKFLQDGPKQQKHELFQRLGKEIEGRLSNKPVWISTSGLGVYWLHVRLDSRPKYYTHAPYKY